METTEWRVKVSCEFCGLTRTVSWQCWRLLFMIPYWIGGLWIVSCIQTIHFKHFHWRSLQYFVNKIKGSQLELQSIMSHLNEVLVVTPICWSYLLIFILLASLYYMFLLQLRQKSNAPRADLTRCLREGRVSYCCALTQLFFFILNKLEDILS